MPSTPARTAASSVASNTATSALSPRSVSFFATSASDFSLRPLSTTVAPHSARPSAIAKPRPREEPVTSATRPSREKSGWVMGMSFDLRARDAPQIAGRRQEQGRSTQIHDPGFAVFAAERAARALGGERERTDRRAAGFLHQDLGRVVEAYEQRHAVGIAGRDHVLLRMTGDD